MVIVIRLRALVVQHVLFDGFVGFASKRPIWLLVGCLVCTIWCLAWAAADAAGASRHVRKGGRIELLVTHPIASKLTFLNLIKLEL